MKDIVCLSYRADELPAGGNLSGREQLFDMLRGYDLQPVVSLGAEGAYQGDQLRVHELLSEQVAGAAGQVALQGVGLIVNRLDRSIKKDRLDQPQLLPPMINENTMRSLAFRKHRTNDEVLAPLGINIPTALVVSPEVVGNFLDTHQADEYVVKPNSGTNGRGVQRLDGASVRRLFAEQPDLYDKQIVQPAYDFQAAFPAGLRPYDAASAEAFEGWNRPGVNKELRIYGFHSPQQTTTFPVGRAIHGEADQWFFVDPESVPARLLERTAAAMRLAAEVSGSAAVLGTVDFGYGVLGDQAPDWRAIELNGKAPYVLGYDKHAGVADALRTQLAAQIAETVRMPERPVMVH